MVYFRQSSGVDVIETSIVRLLQLITVQIIWRIHTQAHNHLDTYHIYVFFDQTYIHLEKKIGKHITTLKRRQVINLEIIYKMIAADQDRQRWYVIMSVLCDVIGTRRRKNWNWHRSFHRHTCSGQQPDFGSFLRSASSNIYCTLTTLNPSTPLSSQKRRILCNQRYTFINRPSTCWLFEFASLITQRSHARIPALIIYLRKCGVCVRVCVHACVRTYLWTCIHTYTHARKLSIGIPNNVIHGCD